MKTRIAITTVAFVVFGAVGIASAAEKPCSAGRDLDNDGRVDQLVSYVYVNSLLRAEVLYTPGSNKPNQRTQFVYDKLGRLWGKAVDLDGDGDAERHFYFDYQADGRLFAEGIDEGPDGWLDQITTYTYGGTVRVAHVDLGADGGIDRVDRLSFMYDSLGRLSRQVLDEGSDGVWEKVTYFNYGANGTLTSEFVDRGGDGSIDEVTSYQFQC